MDYYSQPKEKNKKKSEKNPKQSKKDNVKKVPERQCHDRAFHTKKGTVPPISPKPPFFFIPLFSRQANFVFSFHGNFFCKSSRVSKEEKAYFFKREKVN